MSAMMFYLHRLSEQFKGFNVFNYVTFRAVIAAITAFALSLLFGNFVIRKLISLKIGQPIRTAEEVRHLAELHGAKEGTPTMGGVLVIGAVFVSCLFWARPDNPFVWLALFSMVYLGVLGFVDDYLKVTKRKSDGISGRLKLMFQLILAGIVTAFFLLNPKIEVQARSLYLPFFKAPVIAKLGLFTFFFFALVIVGSSNAVNLTDGLDASRSAAQLPLLSRTRFWLTPAEIFALPNICRSRFIHLPANWRWFARRSSALVSAFSGSIVIPRNFSWVTPARSQSAGSLAWSRFVANRSCCS